jgi:hypothetical protein
MKLRGPILLSLFVLHVFACTKSQAARVGGPLISGEPDYSVWNRLLATYSDPTRGMDYAGVKAQEARTLERLRGELARVNARSLSPKQQLAFWINLYNVNVVSTVVAHYPVASIRDISTDPIIRLNVFKKDTVAFGNGAISLNTIENEKLQA